MSKLSQLQCACTEIIMKSRTSGEWVVKNKVIVVRQNQVFAVCKACTHEVLLPLTKLDFEPKLYLDK